MSNTRQHANDALAEIRRGTEPVIRLIENAPTGAVPAFNYHTGGYRLDREYLPDSWATFQWTGFLTGRLWLLGEHFDDNRIRDAARHVADLVVTRLAQRPPLFSAAGGDLFYTACLGSRVAGHTDLTGTALAAARQYARNLDPTLGVFLQMTGVNRAVIDTGLNLLPFYWAGTHDPELPSFAVDHNQRLLTAGIIRDDGSAFQAIEFDPTTRAPRRHYTMQGFADDTTWARGQSWAMHNYVNAFEATGRPEFLEATRKACGWYVEHLPDDGIPFYDFGDPATPDVPRDSCSAAISANALLKLSRLDPESGSRWKRAADAIIDALLRRCLSPGGVLLHGSWGRLSAEKAGAGLSRFPQEDVMPYGNYWIVEALYRRAHGDWDLLALAPRSAPRAPQPPDPTATRSVDRER